MKVILNTFYNPRNIKLLLLFIISALVGIEMLMNLTPPTTRDVLIHHLAIPKLYIKNGGLYDIPFSIFSYYPMNLSLLYIIPLLFNNDIIPKYIHMSFGLLTGLIIFLYIKKRINTAYALLGSLVFLSIPIIIKLSTSAMVDLGLTFFSTLALLLIIKWIDSDFDLKWLVASAVSCGLALGTKYNALIVFLLLSLMVIFLNQRYQRKGTRSLLYGIFFIFISLLIYSPWGIKNIIQKGNPIYPLYNNYLNIHHNSHSAEDDNYYSHYSLPDLKGPFGRRRLLYGENWLDIILIPFRIFFQGRDNSGQYFDGVLNPILLLFTPFALFRHHYRRDMIILMTFSILYLLFAFSSHGMRIRYILPIIPPMTIMTTFGIKRLTEIRSLRYPVPIIIIILLSYNIPYLNKCLRKTDPVPYITGKETRDEYLLKHLPDYGIFKYINDNLPTESKIMFLFMGNRGYYCNREYIYDARYSGVTLMNQIRGSTGGDDIYHKQKKMGITHILMDKRLVLTFLGSELKGEEEIKRFQDYAKDHLQKVFIYNRFYLYKLT